MAEGDYQNMNNLADQPPGGPPSPPGRREEGKGAGSQHSPALPPLPVTLKRRVTNETFFLLMGALGGALIGMGLTGVRYNLPPELRPGIPISTNWAIALPMPSSWGMFIVWGSLFLVLWYFASTIPDKKVETPQ